MNKYQVLCYCSLAKPDPHTKSKTLVSQDWQLRLSLKETPDFTVNERQTGSCMRLLKKEMPALNMTEQDKGTTDC